MNLSDECGIQVGNSTSSLVMDVQRHTTATELQYLAGLTLCSCQRLRRSSSNHQILHSDKRGSLLYLQVCKQCFAAAETTRPEQCRLPRHLCYWRLKSIGCMQGVCHRDLKLENTLLDGRPAPRLKICDFGYSKSAVFDSQPKSTVGTPAYIAPEVRSLLCLIL